MKYGLQQRGDYKRQLLGTAKSSTFQGYNISYYRSTKFFFFFFDRSTKF